jgi:hypothetical protein
MRNQITPAQARTAAKRDWADKLRKHGHVMQWKYSGGRSRRWHGRCKNCPGEITVYLGGSVDTTDLKWPGCRRIRGGR